MAVNQYSGRSNRIMRKQLKQGNIITDYIILIFFILWSGGCVTYGQLTYWELLTLPLFIFIFYKRRCSLTKVDYTVLVSFLIIALAQSVVFGANIGRFINTIAPIIIGVLSAHIIASNFSTVFTRIIYFFAYASLIFYCIDILGGHKLLMNIANQLPQFGADTFDEINGGKYGDSLYLYLVSYKSELNGFVRNFGPFWEPGRFTIYLTLALAINIFNRPDKFITKHNIVILLANVTTFSTTGYVALGVAVVVYILISNKSNITKFLYLLFIFSFVVLYVVNLDFMQAKIIEQMNSENEWSRFTAMSYHWKQIINSPIIGYGRNLADEYVDLITSPNGWTDLIRYWGIPITIIYCVLLYKGIDKYVFNRKIICQIATFLIILTVAFSQTVMISPFYYVIMFMGCIKQNNYINEYNK